MSCSRWLLNACLPHPCAQLNCEDFSDLFLGSRKQPSARVQEVDASGTPIRPKADPLLRKLVRHFKWLQDAYVLPRSSSKQQTALDASTAAAPAAPAASSAAASSAAASPSSSSSSAAPASEHTRIVYLLKKAQLMIAELYLRFHVSCKTSGVEGCSIRHPMLTHSQCVHRFASMSCRTRMPHILISAILVS